VIGENNTARQRWRAVFPSDYDHIEPRHARPAVGLARNDVAQLSTLRRSRRRRIFSRCYAVLFHVTPLVRADRANSLIAPIRIQRWSRAMRRSAKIPKPSPPSSPYRRICAWCHADLGSLWPGSQAHSYGICSPCTHRYFPDLYEADGQAEPSLAVPATPDAPHEDTDTASGEHRHVLR
jgi:hypothetical protein